MTKQLNLTIIFIFFAITSANNLFALETVIALQPLFTNTQHDYPVLHQVIQQADKYRVQILYTQINRDENNNPHFIRYQLGIDDNKYFYPASTVKLPIALLALEWVQQHKIFGINEMTTMLTDSASSEQSSSLVDITIPNGHPSIAHYIKKILLVSDNDASNRLYELLGQDYINQSMKSKGFTNTLISHRLSVKLSAEQNRFYNPIRFVDNTNKVLFELPARKSTTEYRNVSNPTIGQAYIEQGKLVNQGMDFTDKNRYSLSDFDSTIKRIVFPQLYDVSQRFTISTAHRKFMLNYMSMLPASSSEPKYDSKVFPDNYSKFLMFGGEAQQLPAHIKIFNKTGWAYGHVIDGAYIVDIKNNIEFIITAVIYANNNNVLNDDSYQINETALPFLNQLGNYFYQLELKRPKTYSPDLSEFMDISR